MTYGIGLAWSVMGLIRILRRIFRGCCHARQELQASRSSGSLVHSNTEEVNRAEHQ
jgi:hypothetical protein